MGPDQFIENLRLKHYPHFDNHMSKEKISTLVNNPDLVARHPFRPFLYFEQSFTKFRLEKGLAPTKKTRPIRYACRADSYIYSKYRHILYSRYEDLLDKEDLSNSIIAYRNIQKPDGSGGKCNIDFAKEAFEQILEFRNCIVVTADISSYFDTIDHATLKMRWASLLGVARLPQDHFNVFKSLTRHSHVDYVDLCRELGLFGTKITKHGEVEGYLKSRKEMDTQICDSRTFRELASRRLAEKNPIIKANLKSYGIPQGAPLSDLLANLYLIEFDKTVSAFCKARGGVYFRYSDDVLLIIPSQKPAEFQEVEDFLRRGIVQAGPKIRIQPKKCASLFYYEVEDEDGLEFEPLSRHLGKKKREKSFEDGKEVYNVVEYDSFRMNNGLEYLGFRFDGKKIYLKDKTLSGFYRKLKRTAWAEAYSHYERHSTLTREDLISRFNFDAYIAKFGKVEKFHEDRDDDKPPFKKWTFHTYIIRSVKILGELGDRIPNQVKRYEKKAKTDVYRKINRVYNMRNK